MSIMLSTSAWVVLIFYPGISGWQIDERELKEKCFSTYLKTCFGRSCSYGRIAFGFNEQRCLNNRICNLSEEFSNTYRGKR